MFREPKTFSIAANCLFLRDFPTTYDFLRLEYRESDTDFCSDLCDFAFKRDFTRFFGLRRSLKDDTDHFLRHAYATLWDLQNATS